MAIVLSVDCMGGDHGPGVTVPAALEFVRRRGDASVILVGREEVLWPLVGNGQDRVAIRDAREVVAMDEPPALALKNKKNSSMRIAINLVKQGEASACVSAGNTGALMATSRFVLKMLPGIDRPAICGILPTVRGHTHVLDLGANVDSEPEHLVQFAIMASALVSAIEDRDRPRIGLLNIGEEEIKGNETVKRAAELIRESGLNFIGNVEGNGIYLGDADVVVCDGFVGNVALKTSEGLAQMLADSLREEFGRGFLTKVAALMALPVLRRFKHRFDHRRYNGATLLGLKGVVIKSHGSADAFAFRHALDVGYREVQRGVLERISGYMAARTVANAQGLE